MWCVRGATSANGRFETGLAQIDDDLGVDFDVTYHAYQLDPTASPGVATPVREAYAKKFGGEERADEILDHVTSTAAQDGITFHMDRALRANTLLAHRLIWLAGQPGSPVAQADMKERVMQAYFTDGEHVGTPEVLAACAAELGFERDDVEDVLVIGPRRRRGAGRDSTTPNRTGSRRCRPTCSTASGRCLGRRTPTPSRRCCARWPTNALAAAVTT